MTRILQRLGQDYIDQVGINPHAREAKLGWLTKIFGNEASIRNKNLEEEAEKRRKEKETAGTSQTGK